MRTFLDVEITKLRRLGFDRQSEILSLLMSVRPDATKLREWLKRHARPGVAELFRRVHEDALAPQDWEFELWFLATKFEQARPLSAWEVASSSDRSSHAKLVAKLARALADAMQASTRPYYPPALELFEDDRAADILKAMPDGVAKHLLAGTKHSGADEPNYWLQNGTPQWASAAKNLAGRFLFPEPQMPPPMLYKLADIANEAAHEPRPDARPRTGAPEARVFARNVAEHFMLVFGRAPNEVIAACVALQYPALNPTPDADTVRDWRGAR